MQSESSEAHLDPSVSSQTRSLRTEAQHGLRHESLFGDPFFLHHDEHNSHRTSGSEWSMSPSSGPSTSSPSDSRLDLRDLASRHSIDLLEEAFDAHSIDSKIPRYQGNETNGLRKSFGSRKARFPLQEFPEELIFHVISHLSASDLLAMKLVSRRFYNIVKSPHAWIDAFARYFPGPDALTRTADVTTSNSQLGGLRSEKRIFTRLGPVVSWTSEYLSRTKLLRCLARGKPAIPFAAPSPGKPNKGYATFTYSSRLTLGISHLQAKFGPVLDKRQPHFVHGYNKNGTVSSSDRRGKLDGWGIAHQGGFQTFDNLYHGIPEWGDTPGEVVGVPNIMDLSSVYGMVYGEGIPGGSVYYLAHGEKQGRYIANLPLSTIRGYGLPRFLSETSTVCSLWIAKTQAVPRLTKGLVGILCGSSDGIISAFSLGPLGDSYQRYDRGEITIRWLLSPGVPIIAIFADNEYSETRQTQQRVWAFAVNALGEVFSISSLPIHRRSATVDHSLEPEQTREVWAWEAGQSAKWRLLHCSQREEKALPLGPQQPAPYYGPSVSNPHAHDSPNVGVSDTESNMWLAKRPSDIQAEFNGWDMRRLVEVDFAGDDGRSAGENVIVFNCGTCENQEAAARRYTRCSAAALEPANGETESGSLRTASDHLSQQRSPMDQSVGKAATSERSGARGYTSNSEWRHSDLLFGAFKNLRITATTIDSSNFALTTCAEDATLTPGWRRNTAESHKEDMVSNTSTHSLLHIAGHRARFVAAGTSTGKIFIWNARAAPSGSAGVINDIRPLRIIHTESPEITALAITALYLVHGGSEGLVQAWDPLASTLEPVRTISSRNTLNARRRAVIAAQQNPLIQAQMIVTNYAATAICLDSDATVLRGIVAIGSHLRYWSYSSTAAVDDLTKSQKRRLNRVARGLSSRPGESFIGTRRVSLKGLVNQEVFDQEMEKKDLRAAQKEQQRLAGRFGTDLLGVDASEEEVLAYAKLLSEEHKKSEDDMSALARLGKDASYSEIEEFKKELNEDELERWRYASWRERFDMPKSHSATPSAATATPTVGNAEFHGDDFEKAIRLSLVENMAPSSPLAVESAAYIVPSQSASSFHGGSFDADMSEAIRLSLTDAEPLETTRMLYKSEAPSHQSHRVYAPFADPAADLAEAIRLSLQDTQHEASLRRSMSFTGGDILGHVPDDEAFPALATPSMYPDTPVAGDGRRMRKDKGKGPVW